MQNYSYHAFANSTSCDKSHASQAKAVFWLQQTFVGTACKNVTKMQREAMPPTFYPDNRHSFHPSRLVKDAAQSVQLQKEGVSKCICIDIS